MLEAVLLKDYTGNYLLTKLEAEKTDIGLLRGDKWKKDCTGSLYHVIMDGVKCYSRPPGNFFFFFVSKAIKCSQFEDGKYVNGTSWFYPTTLILTPVYF